MSSTTATAGKTNVKALVGIVAFCIFVYINNMTMGILAYIMASYSDVSTTVVQTILVTPSLVGTIYGFAFGNLNKRFSVKTLLIFAEVMLLLEGVVFLLFGGVLPIYVMIVAAGFVGFMQGSANTLLGLLLLDAVPDEGRRNSLLGVCMAAMNIGGVALVTTGGVLAVGRWNNAYYLYLFIILVIVIDIICLPNTKPEGAVAEAAGPAEAQVEAAPVEKGSMKKAWILSAHYLFYFLFLYVYGTNISEYVITTHQLGTSVEAGIASSCVTVGGIIAGVLYGFYSPILKKWTAPILMALAMIGIAIPVFFTGSLPGLYLAGILGGFSMNGCTPYIISRMHNMVPDSMYGKAMSIYAGFMNAGMVVAIYVLNFLTQIFFGDAGDVQGKFTVAAAGLVIVFITSIPVYVSKDLKDVEGA